MNAAGETLYLESSESAVDVNDPITFTLSMNKVDYFSGAEITVNPTNLDFDSCTLGDSVSGYTLDCSDFENDNTIYLYGVEKDLTGSKNSIVQILFNSGDAGEATMSVDSATVTIDYSDVTPTVSPNSVSVTIASPPDLVVNDVAVSKSNIKEKEDPKPAITADIQNIGGSDITSGFDVSIIKKVSAGAFLNGEYDEAIGTKRIVGLGAGDDETTEALSWDVVADGDDTATRDVTICTYVDSEGEISESNEDTSIIKITIGGSETGDNVLCRDITVTDGDDDGDGYFDDDCDDNDPEERPDVTWYQDADGDGYYDKSQLCEHGAGSGWGTSTRDGGDDCNDNNADMNPAAEDICDGIDNDCKINTLDGADQVSELNTKQEAACFGLQKSCLNGAMQDDYSQVNTYEAIETSCDSIDNDCDGNIDLGLVNTYYDDTDNDSYGDSAKTKSFCSKDLATAEGYVSNSLDCDINNITCNIDCTSQVYEDFDTDGYGNSAVSHRLCDTPGGYIVDNTDCDDNNALINPGKQEICDPIDHDCDGDIHNGLSCSCNAGETQTAFCGKGICLNTTQQTCSGGVWGPVCSEKQISQEEMCNSFDDDCDGLVDEDSTNNAMTVKCYSAIDPTTEGKGICHAGLKTCSSGQLGECIGEITPTIEDCDGIDNDCNGLVDDISSRPTCTSKGYSGFQVCSSGQWGSCDISTSCQVSAEVCDGIDNDCDGEVDEDFKLASIDDALGEVCSVGLGSCQSEGVFICKDDWTGTECDATPIASGDTEVCANLIDNDCDGLIACDDSDCDGESNIQGNLCYYPANPGNGPVGLTVTDNKPYFSEYVGYVTGYVKNSFNPISEWISSETAARQWTVDNTDDGSLDPADVKFNDYGKYCKYFGLDNEDTGWVICSLVRETGRCVGSDLCSGLRYGECIALKTSGCFWSEGYIAEVCNNGYDDDNDGAADCDDSDCNAFHTCASCSLNQDTNIITTQVTCSYAGKKYTDYCASADQLVQYNCGISGCESTLSTCDEGYTCDDGACILGINANGMSIVVTDKATNTRLNGVQTTATDGVSEPPIEYDVDQGKAYRFDVYVNQATSLPEHILVLQILNDNRETVAFTYIKKKAISAGDTSVLGVTYSIPEESYGKWTLKAFVWNNWVSAADWEPLFNTEQITIDLGESPECLDSDGTDAYDVKGYVSYQGEINWDKCTRPSINNAETTTEDYVSENYCDEDGVSRSKQVFCENGCFDGACIINEN